MSVGAPSLRPPRVTEAVAPPPPLDPTVPSGATPVTKPPGFASTIITSPLAAKTPKTTVGKTLIGQ